MGWGPEDHSVALTGDPAHCRAIQILCNSKCHSMCHHLNRLVNSVTSFSPISTSLEKNHLSNSHHRNMSGTVWGGGGGSECWQTLTKMPA